MLTTAQLAAQPNRADIAAKGNRWAARAIGKISQQELLCKLE
jgi:hypothetical protein